MKDELQTKIEQLTRAFPEDKRFPLQVAIEGPIWKNNPLATKCLDLITEISDYNIFNKHLQYLGNSGFTITYEQLLDWLIDRTRSVGSQNAINDLDSYISKDEVSVEQIELVIGTHSDCQWEFSNGVKYANPEAISDTSLATDLLSESFGIRTPIPKVTAVLIAKFENPVIHQIESDTDRAFDRIKIPYDTLKITRLILSLVRNVEYGIHSIASTTVAPDNLPFLKNGQRWEIIPFRHPPIGPTILELEFRQADELLIMYESLKPPFKEKLRIPLEKLNSFGSGESLEDRAVDLRICLESIFLADGNKEQLRYRVSLRAALFLGGSLEERKRIFKVVRDSYDMTSSVIHNGKCGSSFDFTKLKETAKLARNAVKKLIIHGDVNWTDLELDN